MFIAGFVWEWRFYLEVMVSKMGLATTYNVYNIDESMSKSYFLVTVLYFIFTVIAIA